MATEQIFFAVEIETGKSATKIERLRANFKGLAAEIKSTERSQKRGSITAKEANEKLAKLDLRLIKARKSYKNAGKAALEAEKSVSKGARAFLKAEKGAEKLNARLKKTSSLSSSITGSFKKAGAAMVAAFAVAAVVKGISAAVNIIKKFEQASANLASVLGKNISQIDALRNSAKNLGATTSFTASQVLELQTELAKLGFTEKEILGATEATLALAEAAGSDLATAAKVVGSTIRAFGLAATDAGRVSDVMARSFSSSALDISKFETAMASVAPAAKAANLSLEETTSLLGILVDNGIDASTAGTALRGILLDGAKAGRTLDESLRLVNDSTNKNAVSFDLFGKRGAVVAQVLAENIERSDALEVSLKNSGGAAKKMAETQLNTLEGRTKLLSSAWEGFVLSLDDGDGLISNLVNGVLSLSTNLLTAASSQEKLSDQLILTNAELNAEFDLLKNANLSTDQRNNLIATMNEKYGEYLPNLLTEASTLKEIEAAQEGANDALKGKILLVATQERLTELTRDAVDADKERFNIQEKIALLESGALVIRGSAASKGHGGQSSKEATQARIFALRGELEEVFSATRIAQKRLADFQRRNANILLADKESFYEEAIRLARENAEREIAAAKAAKGPVKKLSQAEIDAVQRKIDEIERLRQLAIKADQDDREKLFTFLLSKDDKEIQALNNKFEKMFTLNVSSKEQERELELKHQEALTALILDQNERRLRDEKKSTDKAAAAKEEARKKELQEDFDKQEFVLDSVSNALGDIQALTNVFTQNKLNSLNRESREELAIINDRESKGLITRDAAEQARRKLEDETATERAKLEKKEFQRNKVFQLAQIGINLAAQLSAIQLAAALNPTNAVTFGAAGITQAAIQSGIAIGSAAINTATVLAQKFAKGGIIQGESHANGGVPIMGGRAEVEGNEIILTSGVTNNPTLAAMANQINVMGGGHSFLRGSSNKFEHGGGLSTILPTFELPQTDNFSSLLAAFNSINFSPTVNVSEISSAQSNVAVAESLATI